ncbi:phosphoribosylformylglycinamidine cyclo-ligase [Ignicoccus pacificus DSM 13166]|uniref:phosphoribosylformylglycinamidine cyclo-ligase n=1 Tax=Ignicoccus pacificus DSM 13166 TaxID=940294 RepID=A0A977PL32_9CREN|nr:phosphoribosylformylglycinamidine cyclo-ligase [Ignicoccus pacificus DSM 13166]
MERWSYAKAGVDINKQKEMQRKILGLIKSRAEGIGSYASSFKLGDMEITLHVDGVGTKTILLDKLGRNEIAGWDCVMVNANDIACEGFKGILLVDYLATEKGDPKLSEDIGKGLTKAIESIGAVLAGGETAIMPDVVKGYDISCTLLGTRYADTREPEPGDKVIAVASTGPHANGYTLIRKLIDAGRLSLDGIEEDIVAPVANYHNPLLDAMKEGKVKWAAHVTGGAFRKVHERLPKDLGLKLDCWEIPEVFMRIVKAGNLDPMEAYTTFNMGVGLIVIGDEESIKYFEREGLKAWVAGEVQKGETRICTPWGGAGYKVRNWQK